MSNDKEVTKLTPLIYWEITPVLRYAKFRIPGTDRYELRLQQMWKGSDRSFKWEYVEVILMKDGDNPQQ